ncbi:hypothetical protein BJV82DRAFT_243846 [Fennellomyces sp. T-0311]|nr:hypothetical protein BJV82DRAFT_243846 [Fennellomyces sp. T-0311]
MLPPTLALTHLNWNGFLPNDAEINNVLNASLKLQYLQVGTYGTSVPVLAIRKRCPQIRYLSLGDVETYRPNDEFWNHDDKSTVEGLRALSMICTNEQSWSQVKQVLSMDQNILEFLTLYHGPQMPIDADYLIRHFRGKQLNLHAAHAAWQHRAQVDAIISRGENSKEAALPRLYNITSTFELGDERGVLGFINALRTGTTAIDDTVSRLRFWKCPGSAILLPLLLDLPCRLQSLQFEDCEFSTTILIGFLRSLKMSPWPTLQELGFFSIPCFTDNLVAEIAGIPGLKTVNLWDCVDITDEGVHSLIDGSTDLEVVDIGGCKQVTEKAIRYVQDTLDARKAL